jgi:outer membrane protein assembly factor BamA
VIGINIGKDGSLALTIREGLTVAKINVAGNPLISPIVIKKTLSLKEGQPYSEDTRDKDFENLKKLYDKYDLQIGDFEAGIDPSSVNLEKGTADVTYTIYVMTVGAVQITGNTKTKDQVIRRQLRLRPGMVVTQGLLKRDYERLNNLGFFDKVELNPKPGPDPKKPYAVTLDWNVKEQRTGTAQIGAGYSGGPNGQGLTGTLSYADPFRTRRARIGRLDLGHDPVPRQHPQIAALQLGRADLHPRYEQLLLGVPSLDRAVDHLQPDHLDSAAQRRFGRQQ